VENFFIGDSLSTRAQPITAITRRGLLVVVVAGSGLARYTEIALPLDKIPSPAVTGHLRLPIID